MTCLKAGLVTVLNGLPKGALKEGEDPEMPVGEGDGHEAEDGVERALAPAASGWTPALRDCWVPHVASATRSQVSVCPRFF